MFFDFLILFIASSVQVVQTNSLLVFTVIAITLYFFSILLISKIFPDFSNVYLVNMLFSITIFNIFFITILCELKWMMGLWNIHFNLILPISFVDLLIAPFIYLFLPQINTFIFEFILILSFVFKWLFNSIISGLIYDTGVTLCILVFGSAMLMTFELYIFYCIFTLIFYAALFIVKTPFFFGLIDNSLFADNILFLRKHAKTLITVGTINNSVGPALLFSIQKKQVLENRPKRFIMTNKPLFMFDPEQLGKGSSKGFFHLVSADNIGKTIDLMEKNPRSMRTIGGVLVFGSLGFASYSLTRQYLKTKEAIEIAERVKQSKLAEYAKDIRQVEMNRDIQLSKERVQISNNELELAKLKHTETIDNVESSIATETEIDSVPPTHNEGSGCILQCSLEREDDISFIVNFLTQFLDMFNNILF